MIPVLNHLANHHDLTRVDASHLALSIFNRSLSIDESSAALLALKSKGETEDEILGFLDVALGQSVDFPHNFETLLDTCGTGGDSSSSFNISTASALVLASGGVKVAKHGNRSSSGRVGSADVLEALGIKIDLTPSESLGLLDNLGFCFLFAPKYHPGFLRVKELRKSLGVSTIFNLLGPLLNPARVTRQILGVNNPELILPFAKILGAQGVQEAFIVHGRDDSDDALVFDEVSISGTTSLAHLKDGSIETFDLRPKDFGMDQTPLSELSVIGPTGSANIIRSIILGHDLGPRRDVVVANAALGFILAGNASSIKEGVLIANSCIDEGLTADRLSKLRGEK